MLVIFSKLEIAAQDRAWIDDIRRKHDPQHRLVEPHFTFVFPFDGLSTDEVVAHALDVATDASRIPFRLSRAAAMRDLLGSGSHVFLLPSLGDAEIRTLHSQFYSGVLGPKRHPTAVFVPHVTVAAFERHEDAERTAASLGSFDITGMLSAVHVVDFDGTRVTELCALTLGSA